MRAGHTSSDEMCNLYLMLYSRLPFFMWCLDKYPAAQVRTGLGVAARPVPPAWSCPDVHVSTRNRC